VINKYDLQPFQGHLYHDVHIATIMKENGISKIATSDKHFRLFPFLKILDPCLSNSA